MNSKARPYRARHQRPCDHCRSRKICCIRESPDQPCSLCKTRGQSCTFLRPPNNRHGPPTVSKQVPPESTRNSVVHVCGTKSSAIRLRYRPGLLSDSIGDDHKHSRSWIAEFVGMSGDHDQYVLQDCLDRNLYRHSEYACLRIQGDDRNSEQPHFAIVPAALLDPRPDWYPAVPEIAADGPEHLSLMQAYRSNIHTAFPLLEAELLDGLPQELDPTLLGTIYALARPFLTQEAVNEDFADTWQAFVFQALPTEKRYPRLSTIEAMCLWLQREPKVTRSPTTPGLWSEIGSLVGLAHVLGLNVDPSSWNISPAQKQRRIRLANMVFIFDKWIALGLGRPSYISADNWTVPLQKEHNQFEAASCVDHAEDTYLGLQTADALTALTVILADLLTEFYTLAAAKRLKNAGLDILLESLNTFEARISCFETEVLNPMQEQTIDSPTDPTGSVILAYWTLRTSLYKAVLRNLPKDLTSCSVGVKQVFGSAREVLVAATDFLGDLTPARLGAFWYSPISRINFAMVGSFMFSMLAFSTEESEVDFWVAQIDLYRQNLERHSVSFDTTKLAARRLEVLACVATGLGDESYLATDQLWNLDM